MTHGTTAGGLRISLVQSDLAWEDKQTNLRSIRKRLEALRGATEIVVLPEMCTTAFSMNAIALAEGMGEETIRTLRAWSSEFDVALAGSFICRDGEALLNRAIFITPEGEVHHADKRHLFSPGGESRHYSAGNERHIIRYRGWRIMLLVCYDLRFPVWSRNRLLPSGEPEYDLLIYVANWPAARRHAWDTLLPARAIENLCYVCGVNRVGTDAHGIAYNGGTSAYDYKGEALARVPDGKEGVAQATLSLEPPARFRRKFPAHLDADGFSLQY